jgi:L-threonylcarbamoyladenylate synthase
MKIYEITPQIIRKVIKAGVTVLKNGGLVIYPTETCYGIGVDATNPEAVEKLFQLKGERNKPVLIAVGDEKMAQRYVKINESAKKLYDKYLPGPLAIISESRGKVDPRLESPEKTLGVRMPNYPLVLAMIKNLGRPITSTSANISGYPNPYRVDDFLPTLSEAQKELISMIIDAGTLPPNPPSTVVDTTKGKLLVLRQGKIKIGSTN